LIIQLEEAKRELLKIDGEIDELGNAMKIEELKVNIASLEDKTLDPDFWNNPESSSILQQIKSMKNKVEAFDNLKKRCEDAAVLAEMGLEENDESVLEEVLAEQESIVKEIETRRIATLLSGEYDKSCRIDLLGEYYETINAPIKKIVIMKSCGHCPQLDEPILFATEVKRLLKKITNNTDT